MVRPILVCACLAAAVGVARSEDPVAEKLFKAKEAHDKEAQQVHKQAKEWLDQRENSARKAGDKKLVDQIKDEREEFEEYGQLPRSAPAALKSRLDRADKAIETAYAEAVKAYTRAKKDALAAEVDEVLKELTAKGSGLDLLALVDPEKHAVGGEWKREGALLVGTSTDSRATLQLPYEPGEAYDLEVKCKRIKDGQYLSVGLVAGGRQVQAVVDDWPQLGSKSGFKLVDGKSVESKDNPTVVTGKFLKNNQSHTLLYSVRNGKIDAALDGKVLFSYKGEFSRLTMSEYQKVPNKHALSVMLGGSPFVFERVVVKAVKGKGKIVK